MKMVLRKSGNAFNSDPEGKSEFSPSSTYCIVVALIVLLLLLLRQTWFRNPVGAQFNDTGMNEVIKMLEKKYHIQIEVNNPQLLRCNFTATLYKIQDKQTAIAFN